MIGLKFRFFTASRRGERVLNGLSYLSDTREENSLSKPFQPLSKKNRLIRNFFVARYIWEKKERCLLFKFNNSFLSLCPFLLLLLSFEQKKSLSGSFHTALLSASLRVTYLNERAFAPVVVFDLEFPPRKSLCKNKRNKHY